MFVGFLLLAAAVALYMLPTILAARADHPNTTSIAIINVALGWSLIGWIVALVWAIKTVETPVVVTELPRPNIWAEPVVPTTRACPFCAEEVLIAAIKCKHCQSDLTVSKVPNSA